MYLNSEAVLPITQYICLVEVFIHVKTPFYLLILLTIKSP